MKAITKYKANDGTEFETEKQCQEYESLCARVSAVMEAWPEHPKNDGCSFVNGGGFIQLTKGTFEQVRSNLLDIIAQEIPNQWVEQSKDGTRHPIWVGRLLSDAGSGPLYSAWLRIQCVDPSFREWGQPYYANNPEKGEQKQIG